MIGKDLISLERCERQDFHDLLALAVYLKQRRRAGVVEQALAGKTLAMVFEKPSLRTRASFEVGMTELGGRAMYLSKAEVGLGEREPVQDVARVLSRYVHGIMIRTFAHQTVCDLAEHASVPVINGLCDEAHPCQALADMLTIYEHRGAVSGQRVVFIGDGNNVARSLARACVLAGSEFVLACPQAYAFSAADQAAFGDAWGSSVQQIHDPAAAVAGATVLYTDVWTSMGQEAERAERLAAFAGYQINDALLAQAADGAIVLHCLPAHRGEEISEGAVEGAASRIFDQAENRLHAQKAVMRLLMADDRDAIAARARSEADRLFA
ncbi:MAG: ornithine carbamoyltransferase [Planctomycetota bacterium]|jgi:ornithine carbamoyltransferase